MEGKSLKVFMSEANRKALGSFPTYHLNCILLCNGVARPGKTAKDRSKRSR
jgi:hypothetical protein